MPYTDKEEILHTWSHALGVIIILCLAGPLLSLAPSSHAKIGLWVFIATFFFVFAASASYHANRNPITKKRLKKLDHIAIYFFIAGSNTPYLWSVSDHPLAWYFLAVMWLIVLFGSVYKFFEWDTVAWLSLMLYLVMGWLGVITVYLTFQAVNGMTVFYILLGGIFYTVGAYFYHHDHRKWYHSVWHGFVLLGAVSHYLAIYLQLKV